MSFQPNRNTDRTMTGIQHNMSGPLPSLPSSWDDAQFGLENAETDHQRSRKRPSSATWHIDRTIAEELPGSTLPFKSNRSCRMKDCKKRYRPPGYLCEDHGGGRCQAPVVSPRYERYTDYVQ